MTVREQDSLVDTLATDASGKALLSFLTGLLGPGDTYDGLKDAGPLSPKEGCTVEALEEQECLRKKYHEQQRWDAFWARGGQFNPASCMSGFRCEDSGVTWAA